MRRSKLFNLVGTVAVATALAVPMLASSAGPAAADWGRRGQYYGGGHWHRGGGGCWNCGFVPGLAVGLGIAGVAALTTAPYYAPPPPVYYAPPPVYYAPPPGYYYYYR